MKAITLGVVTVVLVMLAAFLLAQEHTGRAHTDRSSKRHATTSPVPLILQDDEGDHLVHRAGPLGGVPFTIKVDSQFGNSEDFFVFAETLAPNQVIPFHKHHNAEEILIFEEPGARVIVGDKSGDANSHSLVFIPRNTWISATNTGRSPIHLLAIFSRHGFETYMRAISSKPGESQKPLNQDELTCLRALGHATYWDTSKGPYPPGVAHP
jgi:mannose-6-phosphate isomerase-like protein (cupin superfamily)